jgi:signal transduction histidine kinase
MINTNARRRCTSAPALAGRWFLAALLTAIALISSNGASVAKDRLSIYAYRDTKALVSLVENAAALMEREGEDAFRQFGQRDSLWLNEDHYIFVYTLDGTCMFHPITPELVGKNVMALHDMNGKPVIRHITEIGKKAESDASGWVFYLWQDEMQLTPNWKSAYIRKVVAPNGQTYLVGSGSYSIKVERPFVEDRVRMAADLLTSAGKDKAFKQFQDPASPFVFLNTFIFVLDEQGRTLVDPAFPTMAGRDLTAFRDAVGFHAIREVLKRLARAEEASVQYLWPKPGTSVTSRKVVHARKVVSGTETLIVGSDFFLATPIWMKVEDAWLRNPPG